MWLVGLCGGSFTGIINITLICRRRAAPSQVTGRDSHSLNPPSPPALDSVLINILNPINIYFIFYLEYCQAPEQYGEKNSPCTVPPNFLFELSSFMLRNMPPYRYCLLSGLLVLQLLNTITNITNPQTFSIGIDLVVWGSLDNDDDW
jgi:hypothetical protein